MKKQPEEFDKAETERRMIMALRGARLAGHKPMESLIKKKPKAKKAKPEKQAGTSARKSKNSIT